MNPRLQSGLAFALFALSLAVLPGCPTNTPASNPTPTPAATATPSPMPTSYPPVTRSNGGVVTTFAGNGSATVMSNPNAAAFDGSGNLYVTDQGNRRILKITPAGEISTFAGSGENSDTPVDGAAGVAKFSVPTGIAVDQKGVVYVSDIGQHVIRKIENGQVSTLAGGGLDQATPLVDATGTAARFQNPSSLALDTSGNLVVTDELNHAIRKVTPQGVVTTLAGSTTAGSADGTGTAATFDGPAGVVADSLGNLFVVDFNANRLRKISKDGVVTTVAGSGTAGTLDGKGTAAQFNQPLGVAIDEQAGVLYVSDFSGFKIRKVSLSDYTVTTLAGGDVPGSDEGTGTAARFQMPARLTVDQKTGAVFVPDWEGNRIRKIQ